MRWLDTRESWDWFKKLWGIIFRAARVVPGERLMFPFSFGPFVGFWAAFEGGVALGNLCLPAGGLSTASRLKMAVENEVDVICCTPTYALHMADAAREAGIDLPASKVRALIVAGEAGGSVPEVRRRIEEGWGARVFDHNGMTEMGAMGFECWERPGEGVHLIESECIAEVIDPATGKEVSDGETGELVLTNLGRVGSPLIRYRTGDHVRLTRNRKCACGRWFARLEGGILGRIDDMFTVRGNNVFPTAVEAVIRRFPGIAEFRVTVTSGTGLASVRIELEPAADVQTDVRTLASQVASALQESLSFRADVSIVAPGALPRFEMKAKRFVRKSNSLPS
jgi:phenylacetate-CoA ligase